MNQGKYVFSQLFEFIDHKEFDKCVKKHNGNNYVKEFSCWNQFFCMAFGHLTKRESLRDIVICLSHQPTKLYHLGIKSKVARSTLAKANENRSFNIYSDFAQILIQIAIPLYADDKDFQIELENTCYALDATTIDLCLSVFDWADFRKTKAGIRLHTLMNLRGSIPSVIFMTNANVHELNILDIIEFERNAFYVFDKGYYDFKRLFKINTDGAYFVIRAKKNIKFKRLYSKLKDKENGIIFDQIGKLTTNKSSKSYPEKIRCIRYYNKDKKKTYVYLTNNLEIEAKTICLLYKKRWDIELFFKWIKQHLKIKVFWGESRNAVYTQIWIAICCYVLIAIIKKKMKLEQTIYEILQIISVSSLSKEPINELFNKNDLQKSENTFCNQLSLFDL